MSGLYSYENNYICKSDSPFIKLDFFQFYIDLFRSCKNNEEIVLCQLKGNKLIFELLEHLIDRIDRCDYIIKIHKLVDSIEYEIYDNNCNMIQVGEVNQLKDIKIV